MERLLYDWLEALDKRVDEALCPAASSAREDQEHPKKATDRRPLGGSLYESLIMHTRIHEVLKVSPLGSVQRMASK